MAPLQSAHLSICISLGCIRPSPKEILFSSIPQLEKDLLVYKEKSNYAEACSESCSRATEALLDCSQAEQYSPLWGMCKIKLPLQWLFCDCIGCRCSQQYPADTILVGWNEFDGFKLYNEQRKRHENKILILYDFYLNDHVDKNLGNLHSWHLLV